jgi:large subunit ribosomal protein L34e
MPEPRFRSRSKRRIQKPLPGGDTEKVYLARKTAVPKCADCGIELKGIPRLSSCEARNTPKSKKTVERRYGGFLCSKCAREKIKQEIRSKQ